MTLPTNRGRTLLPDQPEGDNQVERAAMRSAGKTTIGTVILGMAIIVFLTRYNLSATSITGGYRTWEEYLVVNMTGLLFLPMLLIFGVFRERVEEFGFRTPDRGAWQLALLLFLVMAPVLVIASRYPTFYNYYPIQYRAGEDWRFLIYYEITFGFYFFCWEFFYRGFLTFGLARWMGFPAAIVLQSIGFGIMHVGKPVPEMIGSFLAGLALGWLAVKGRSFLPCFALHWAIAFSFDLLAIQARRGGIF